MLEALQLISQSGVVMLVGFCLGVWFATRETRR